ncbi:hypothetical protein AWB77_04568 [Caballeronia fortuita]|uniref:Uncharacterized protein n=1 Tax=Caballeronia fortuita TaxID=1777138 RepID=A0A158CUR9_9BURK|nr:hypothetical protein AWB77_04568 [Caballeronia fortuita]
MSDHLIALALTVCGAIGIGLAGYGLLKALLTLLLLLHGER